MIALGYVRRSKESDARTVSLEDQRARIEAYCQEHSFAVAEILADDGVSGGRRERLERLAERIKATGARIVVVYHLDRFARADAFSPVTSDNHTNTNGATDFLRAVKVNLGKMKAALDNF